MNTSFLSICGLLNYHSFYGFWYWFYSSDTTTAAGNEIVISALKMKKKIVANEICYNKLPRMRLKEKNCSFLLLDGSNQYFLVGAQRSNDKILVAVDPHSITRIHPWWSVVIHRKLFWRIFFCHSNVSGFPMVVWN